MPISQLLEKKQAERVVKEPSSVFATPLTEPAALTPLGPHLEVRSVTRGLAAMYERLRNTLDFRDEHLIRIFAIRRILKRRLIRGARADHITLPLLQELIRSGYILNTAVAENAIPHHTKRIEKYIQLFYFLLESANGNVSQDVWSMVFTLAANEIEDTLSPVPRRHAVAQALIDALRNDRILEQWSLGKDEEERQYIIAVYKSLLKANNELATWQMFLRAYPDWQEELSVDRVRQIAQQLPELRRQIENSFRHPVRERLTRHIKPAATALWLLQESLAEEKNVDVVLARPSLLKEKLATTISMYYKNANRRLRRILWRSLLYIFVTKMAIALLLEIPFDRLVSGAVDLFSISFNVLVPPMLLLIFGLSVQVPGKKNTQLLETIVDQLVYEGQLKLDPLKKPPSRRKILDVFFNLFYSCFYLVSFGFVVWMLLRMHFNVLAIVIFLFFLSIVSFFGFRIREQAQELIVAKGEERFLVFLAVLFFLPILRTGRWISQQSSKINVFLYFFDLFIEAPLQSFLEFFDQFTGFVREKKEDVTS
ncbi:MAG: hypothetical protein V1778_03185 [bacterium]